VALGFGFRCGFLGLLHMDIIQERIRREFNVDLLVTAPTVIYRVTSHAGKRRSTTARPSSRPTATSKTIEEPYVSATVVVPSEFVGGVMQLCQDRRGRFIDMRYLTPTRVVLKYEMPLSEVVVDFYDALKSISKGYASFDYDHAGYRPGELLRMDILINEEEVDAFSFVVPEAAAYQRGGKSASGCGSSSPARCLRSPSRRSWAGGSSPGKPCAPCARTSWPNVTAATFPANGNCWKSRRKAKNACASSAPSKFPRKLSSPCSVGDDGKKKD
jgi:hypothetical protein